MNSVESPEEPLSSSPSMNPPTVSITSASTGPKPKTPLKKEELEKIAKQLKNKLSRASITAKQSYSPTNKASSNIIPKSSPLKSYMLKKNGTSPVQQLSLSPNLYSPIGKSPTHIRTPAAIYLASSPLKNVASDGSEKDLDSPTKRRKTSPTKDKGPQMVLEEIPRPNTPSRLETVTTLKPSLDLTTSKEKRPVQTTPVLAKRDINSATNPLLKTPTQTKNGGAYNDSEGADLLMYLATSPSPAKPFFPNTPRVVTSAPTSAGGSLSLSHKPTSAGASSSSFIAPPPVTPKRHVTSSARTPQNRLTPSMNLFNNLGGANSGLPSSGLTLTPTGFNMNDYVNFFTPSPGAALNKNLLKTPDFNNLLNGLANGGGENGTVNPGAKPKIDGKMLNFNKVLFGNGNPESKE